MGAPHVRRAARLMDESGLFVGLTTFDLIHYVEAFPEADEKIQARERWSGAGGPAANAAAAFAVLGGTAVLVTAVGDGPLAGAVRTELAQANVEVVNVAQNGSLPTSSVVVDASGARTVVSMNAAAFEEDAFDAPNICVADFDVVMADSHYPRITLPILEDARRAAIPIVSDPGSRKPSVDALIAMSDHVILSRGFDRALSAVSLLDAVDGDPTLSAVTAGPAPVLVRFAGRDFSVPVPNVAPIDTLGAGDVFHGAYALALSRGQTGEEAIEVAATAAATSCENLGPRPATLGDDVGA